MSSRFALLAPEVTRLRVMRNRFPIFGELQYRSAVAVQRLYLQNVFRDPDSVLAQFTGLVQRVNRGLQGTGTPAWQRMMRFGSVIPHETMIFGGPLVHIPEDIRGGLQDTLRDLGRLPREEDYWLMYAAVRASMRSVREDLLLQVGDNTTSSAIGLNEGVISRVGRDPVQYIRDRELSLLGGTPILTPPPEETIRLSLEAIYDEPSTRVRIVTHD